MIKSRTPWSWIPTLYVAEGLPYFAVNVLTVLMFSNMGLSKADMAYYTGWLYLPWVIKPFWSPFLDLFRTKRLWIIGMQLLIALSMASVALSLDTSMWLGATLAAFWLMAFASATHDIAADGFYIIALSEKEQAGYVGIRSTFYRLASVLGQGGLVILAGNLENTFGDIATAWGITFAILSAFFIAVFCYHICILPRPLSDRPMPGVKASTIGRNFISTFFTFFRKPWIVSALAFMLFYRLPEALCIKLVPPFLLDSTGSGGLALTTTQVGVINGTIGVLCLLAGGIAGGVIIAKRGLRKCMWPMAAALALPCGVYCYLAMWQPDNYIVIASLIGIEQFGYGYGFTAYMLFMMHFCRGENSSSHYALCTAAMALGMMLPGMAAGWIFERMSELAIHLPELGDMLSAYNSSRGAYGLFFIVVMLTTLVTFAVTWRIWLNLSEHD